MSERPSKDKGGSWFPFVAAIGLFATGLVALLVGLFCLIVGELKYGAIFLAYGVVAVAIAMFGSDRTVLASVGLYFPWRWK